MKKLLLTLFAATVVLSSYAAEVLPRAEYPRPQFERAEWVNLNGTWSYTFDFGKSGMDRRLFESKGFESKIIVPFCPQSELSGVKYTDFINAMWYHRMLDIPQSWDGKRIVLHFGAVDYFAGIYIDGKCAERHWGGSSSFEVDITPYVKAGGQHNLIVRVEDDERSGNNTKGKQSPRYESFGCEYTRTTGIWQTVWMEAVDKSGLKRVRVTPELDQKSFVIQPEFYALQQGQKFSVKIKDNGKIVAAQTQTAATPLTMIIPIKNVKTWSPESPFLYDVELEVLDADNKVIDKVNSYAGMRKVHIVGNQVYLNNKPCYQRLVLDQGFYPTGIWTAPSDADLKRDIELGMAAGFNGARLHQKVFEERFHYWADKLGYLTWGESANWGANINNIEAARNFLTEWEECVVRDRNHPSIIIWTPFNETWEHPEDREQAKQAWRFVSDVYRLTHNLDYRPVNDVSGNYHVLTDLWTVHQYKQDPTELKDWLSIKDGKVRRHDPKREAEYAGQPYLIDEYGGIKWVVGKQFASDSWGYGDGPKTLDEFYARLQGQTDAILDLGHIVGYCYTQLTDVEQEQNGIYNYDRTPKFDMTKIKAVFSKEPEKK